MVIPRRGQRWERSCSPSPRLWYGRYESVQLLAGRTANTEFLYLLCWLLFFPLNVCIPRVLPNLPSSILTLFPPLSQNLASSQIFIAFQMLSLGVLQAHLNPSKKRGFEESPLLLHCTSSCVPMQVIGATIHPVLSPGNWVLTFSLPAPHTLLTLLPQTPLLSHPKLCYIQVSCSTSFQR